MAVVGKLSWVDDNRRRFQMVKWLIPAIMATMIYGAWGFFPKLSSRYLTPGSAIIYEVLGGVIFGVLALAWAKGRPETDGRGILFACLTGFCMLAGGLCYLYACQSGPLGTVVTLTALYPLITILLSLAFLGEKMTGRQWIGVALALTSGWFLSQSQQDP